MKKIMLTGGKGFFCSRLADYYRDKYEFLVTDKEELDFTDAKAVDACVGEYRPDIIVHAGAIAVTDFCNPMVFISSEQVFNGNTAGSPFQEEDEAVPNTVYGENKLEAEGLLKNILGELWIARFTWMFGLPERGKNMSNGILWDTLTKLWNQETIVASRHEFRGMAYVYETIANFERLFEISEDNRAYEMRDT